jgi:HAD superfamily hydrolase (TIGR01549 family)
MLKAAIFDIDGTLLNSVDQHAEAWQRAFDRYGFHFPFDRIRREVGKGGDKLLGVFLTEKEKRAEGQRIEAYRAALFKYEYLASCKPFPDVRRLFQALRDKGIQRALGSSGKKDEVEVYIRILGIADLVDQYVTSDDVEGSKPDPDTLAAARNKLGGLAPGVCCFVGDSPHDAEAAKRDGTKMIGVLCGGFPEADLRACGASAIYLNPSDLLTRWDLRH